MLSGNEAIARGAYEAGVTIGTGYPGTPSTEILEHVAEFKGAINCEWSVNEKVAMEIGVGASLAGVRAMVSMKHVGLNVAMDPLMTFTNVGAIGGMVIINAPWQVDETLREATAWLHERLQQSADAPWRVEPLSAE